MPIFENFEIDILRASVYFVEPKHELRDMFILPHVNRNSTFPPTAAHALLTIICKLCIAIIRSVQKVDFFPAPILRAPEV